jgi:hypothetical protein
MTLLRGDHRTHPASFAIAMTVCACSAIGTSAQDELETPPRQSEPASPGTPAAQPVPSQSSSGAPKDCANFDASAIDALCSSLNSPCEGECLALTASIGALSYFVPGRTGQAGFICGEYHFTWYRPEDNIGADCLPRPECYEITIVRTSQEDAVDAQWAIQQRTWWDDTGICQEWPERGASVFDDLFRQAKNHSAEYGERLPHGYVQYRRIEAKPIEIFFDELRRQLASG